MMTEKTLIKAARIVTPRGIERGAQILIEGGRITRVGEAKETLAADAVIELEGASLLPGFVDLHIHGAVGVDVTSATTDEMNRVAVFLAGRGTTTWLPTFVPAPDEDYRRGIESIDELIARQKRAESTSEAEDAGARVAGVHYEGPFVNHAQCGALRTAYFKEYGGTDDLRFMRKLKAEGAIHLTTLAPEIVGGIELIKELRARNFVVSIGHTRADVETLNQACATGARHITHLFNAMSAVHHRSLGVAGWALTTAAVTCDFIADGLHVDKSILQLIYCCKGADGSVLISDAVLPAGLSDGEYEFWDETIKVRNGITQNERGSIAGSVITMIDAVKMMLSLDVPLADVARMAATNPARVLGIEHETGLIETGKRADLVALDESGEVVLTIVGGQEAYSRARR